MGGSKKPKELPFYRQDTSTLLASLQTKKDGLSEAEAMQRRVQYGPNALKQLHRESAWHKYIKQYKDLMILLLIACTGLAFFTDDQQTGIVLIALILLNTIIGFTQEYKAEKLMQSLEQLVVDEAKVVRNGKVTQIAASELVPGEIVYIEEGDSVPADLRLISESELSTNDFALTGESNPSRKFTHAIGSSVELANRHNLAFMGTTVATGHAYGVVIGTGMQTELGRIASLSVETKNDLSPLQRELNNIAKRVSQGTIILCIILLPLAMYFGLPFKNALLFAIGIASAIIPQGLPAEINTALAQAANKLAKAKALVKKLSAVETLGSTTIICTDKTGTLTKNQMTVQEVLIGYKRLAVSGTGYEPKGSILDEAGKKLSDTALRKLTPFFITGVFASNASVNEPDDDHPSWHTIGDPTEGALLTLARKAGLDIDQLSKDHPELKEFAFDSGRKRMSSIRTFGKNGALYVFVKGAPESVLEKCTQLWDGGAARTLTSADRKLLDNQNTLWANNAMRNLGFAYKMLPKNADIASLKMDDVEKNLTFLGMVSMVDPLREEVHKAIADAQKANVKISIITGDFAPTAKAVALKAGLGSKSQSITVVSGEELRTLEDTRIIQLVTQGAAIFSRVSPEDKLRIVGLIKDSGNIVAVTGDGINDAPALKRADIGVAMGITGTDVSKQSSDIILLDDSFSTLVKAIQQGRVIYQNIHKAALSCFTSNSAELVVGLVSLGAFILFDIPLALLVMQILAIDLIAELFPIAALGWDKADSNLMEEEPRDPKKHILNAQSVADLLWCGLLIGGLAFTNFILFFWRHGIDASTSDAHSPALYLQATTICYLTIVLCQLLNIMQRRSRHGLFTRYQFHNKAFWIAIAFSVFCVALIIYSPVVSPYFQTMPLDATDWLYALGAAAIFILVREVQRHANKHHSRDAVIKLYHQATS